MKGGEVLHRKADGRGVSLGGAKAWAFKAWVWVWVWEGLGLGGLISERVGSKRLGWTCN